MNGKGECPTVDLQVDILNEAYAPNEELIVEEFSGEIADLSDRVKEVMKVKDMEDVSAGDWVTIVDGEVIYAGQMHPFRIEVSE